MLRGRLTFASILVGVMAASTMQLFALTVLAVDVIDEFDITRTQVGFLGAANTGVGALLAPRLGRLTDEIGARRSVLTICVMSALGLVVSALSPTFWVLVVASIVSGFPQGWGNSATNKLIAERADPGARGVITGIKQSGVQFAVLLSGFTLPAMAGAVRWRWAVGLYAIAALAVGLVAWQSLGGDAPVRANSPAEAARRREEDREALPGFVYRVALYALFLGIVAGGVGRFLPLFANEELGFSVTRAGVVVGLGGLLGMVARVAWGRIAEVVMSARLAMFLIAIGSTATAGLLLAATTLGGWTLWIVAVGSAFFLAAWNVVAMLAVIQSVPTTQSGRATGVVMLAFLGGLTASGPALGWSVDQTGDYQLGWMAATLIAALGIVTMAEPRRFFPAVSERRISASGAEMMK